MKFLVSFVLVIFVANVTLAKIYHLSHKPPPITQINRSASTPTLHTIEQLVDNFDPTNNATWNMRYYSNGQFFKNQGPLIIYLGGEWEIVAGSLMGGQVFDIARENDGQMFYTEHRYYGKSYPTPDLRTEDLIKYLNVDQALADVAHFIRTIKSENPSMAHSKVAVIGGSYSATMATWMRKQYPDLVDAAYSSSAPLLAIEDFYQYFEVVSDNIKLISEECWQSINNAYGDMVNMMETPEGTENLSESLNTCERPFIATDQNRWSLFNGMANIFAGLVQYAQPGQIDEVCVNLLKRPGNDADKLISYVRDAYEGSCISNYDDEVKFYSKIDATTGAGRQWLFQTCNEFGFFQTASSDKQPFWRTFPVQYMESLCKDIFNYEPARIQERIERTNRIYEALTPNVTNVISIHGTVDPWHAIGLLKPLDSTTPTFLVKGYSHCQDLQSISSSDSSQMRDAKQAAKDYIFTWINPYTY